MLGVAHGVSEAGLLAAVFAPVVLLGAIAWSSYGVPAAIWVADGIVHVRVRGLNRIWALSGGVSFPAAAVSGVWVETGPLRPRGWRMPGTAGFGVIEGTYVEGGRREFWAVGRGRRLVVLELADQPFARLVLQVADADSAVEAVRREVFG